MEAEKNTQEAQIWAKLVPLSGSGRLHELKTPQVTIGSRPGLTITLTSPGISPVHAIITRGACNLTTEMQVFVPDMVVINDRIIDKAGTTLALFNGDMILMNKNQIGSSEQESFIFAIVFDKLKRSDPPTSLQDLTVTRVMDLEKLEPNGQLGNRMSKSRLAVDPR